jgi:hypothetical protein
MRLPRFGGRDLDGRFKLLIGCRRLGPVFAARSTAGGVRFPQGRPLRLNYLILAALRFISPNRDKQSASMAVSGPSMGRNMKISVDPYRFLYFVIIAGVTCMGVAALALRGILSLVEGAIGFGLIVFAVVRLSRLPKRWL